MATRKKKAAELLPQEDPKAPLDGAALLKAAAPVLKSLEKDLLERADSSDGVTAALKARHAGEKAAERTAENYQTWRRAFVEQVAAAWFLSVVFVRVLEDRGLIERARIAGPGAVDSQRSFFALAPSLSERDYLLTVFKELSHFPAVAELFSPRYSLVWLLSPSAQAAQQLLAFFRQGSAEHPAFRFGGDTRFLGDIYQDLNEEVRKRYALLQTPDFVAKYILDKTLEPAIRRYGIKETTLIDPTCGSGHFLLDAFERLYQYRLLHEPNVTSRFAAQDAARSVAGADINPYAIFIARFRLTLACIEKGDYRRLKDAPSIRLRLAVADSLLHNHQLNQMMLGEHFGSKLAEWQGEAFAVEDEKKTREVLDATYAAVVGNPPYITVKDAALRDRYRAMYSSAFREYSLAVPFKERFFQLGRDGAYVGMITANSFMKREFGKKVIQEYLPTVNLTSIINTSGAYIPGHGTPTVMLFGTSERPLKATVHTVLASRGEPSTPADPEQGLVWRSIADHGEEVGFENDYITVSETERESLANHPWSLSGGGATDLKALLESKAEFRLSDIVDVIGFVCMTRADDIYFTPRGALHRAGIQDKYIVENVEGEVVRDWAIHDPNTTVFPYDDDLTPTQDVHVHRFLWPYRTLLWLRREPNGNHKEIGLTWWEWSRFQRERFTAPLKITFAEVATHNHFVLDRGGKVFKQTAPIIKLPESATEDDHYALLAYLNSSTACFWMKQVCFKKYSANQKHNSDISRLKYAFSGTALSGMPLPRFSDQQRRFLTEAARKIDQAGLLQQRLLADRPVPSAAAFAEWDALQEQMVPLQEEIDWVVYEAFGFCRPTDHDLDIQPVGPGGRPFELEMGHHQGFTARIGVSAQKIAADQVPQVWIDRKNLISGEVQFIETPEFKRTWRFSDENKHPLDVKRDLSITWEEEELLDLFESQLRPAATVTTAPDVAVRTLAERESVPFLDVYTYRDTGLEKRAAWQATWQAQRLEDRGKSSSPAVPPEYSQGSRGKSTDFIKATYWRLRGKLDVPKERFISYPGCESDEDGEPVYGWAGWDHRQRAVALATLYGERKSQEGWPKERLQPMLAGILELLPWLVQWHNQPDEAFDGAIPAVQFREFLDAECAEHGFTTDDLRAWRPPEKKRAPQKAARTTRKAPKKSSKKKASKKSEVEETPAPDESAGGA